MSNLVCSDENKILEVSVRKLSQQFKALRETFESNPEIEKIKISKTGLSIIKDPESETERVKTFKKNLAHSKFSRPIYLNKIESDLW